MNRHFIWYRFHVMSAATGYVSPLQVTPMAPVSYGHLMGKGSMAPRPLHSVLPSVSPFGTHGQS